MSVGRSGAVPKLRDKKDYVVWKSEFEGFADQHGFRDIMRGWVEGPVVIEPIPGAAQAILLKNFDIAEGNRVRAVEFNTKMKKGFGCLKQAVAEMPILFDAINRAYPNVGDLRGAWTLVTERMESQDLNVQGTIEDKIKNVKQGATSMTEYAATLAILYSQLTVQPSDQSKKLQFARGLHKDYKHYSDSQIGTAADAPTYDRFVTLREAYYEKEMHNAQLEANRTTDSRAAELHCEAESANFARAKYGGRGRGFRGGGRGIAGRGRGRFASPRDAGTSNSNKRKLHSICFNCKKKGHYERECRLPKAADTADESNERRVKPKK